MSQIVAVSRKVLKNPAIIYMLSRYATYIIQFINSLFIAIYLGPYYLGIWGFLNLIISYLSQINFGIPHSVNVIVSINKKNEEYSREIIGNGFSMLFFLSLLIILFFGLNYLGVFEIGEKYSFSRFIFPVVLISILTHITVYLSNIFRIYGQVFSIAIYQSIYPVLLLLVVPFFRGENLLWAMLFVYSLSYIAALIFFIIKRPIKLSIRFNWDSVRKIQARGWHLFIYNASFYLILLTTKSFISGNYMVKEFGYFTFSYSLANVVLMLLNSISFLIFPKMLHKFASSTNEEIQRMLSSIRVAYISLSHLLIHGVIMFFPLFIYFFPQYQQSVEVFRVTALTVVLYTNSFGYQGVMMARGKEKEIGMLAFCALMLNALLCFILVYIVKVPFSMVIVATMITYLCYVFAIAIRGRKNLELPSNLFSTLKDIFPFRMMLPLVTSVLFVIFQLSDLFFILPFVAYLTLNIKEFKVIKNVVYKVVKNPNFINI